MRPQVAGDSRSEFVWQNGSGSLSFRSCAPCMNETVESSSCPCGTRQTDTRHGRRLEYLTLGWNITEAAIAIAAGLLAGSIALIGFGADSVIESLSSIVLLWRLQSHEADERRERVALRLVGLCFVVLAAYVAFDAAQALIRREAPDASLVGIALASVSVIVMPLLARAKRRVAARLASAALAADSRQTNLCAYLSAILLGGLALNAAFGWWWADPVAALIMVPIIIREGLLALRGEACHDCH
jgi:divalent metal cation (Fe/Co/Zn/Cd) transporter